MRLQDAIRRISNGQAARGWIVFCQAQLAVLRELPVFFKPRAIGSAVWLAIPAT